MADSLSPKQRVETMRRVKSSGTGPELQVRRLCRELGMPGYRVNRADLPGKPDVAFIGRKMAIFVHGCFWHRHECRAGSKVPTTNIQYWARKFQRNTERDKAAVAQLESSGWTVLTLWECELANSVAIRSALQKFFLQHKSSKRR